MQYTGTAYTLYQESVGFNGICSTKAGYGRNNSSLCSLTHLQQSE